MYVSISHHRYLYNDEDMSQRLSSYEIPRPYRFNTDERVNTGSVQDEPHGEESVKSAIYTTVI